MAQRGVILRPAMRRTYVLLSPLTLCLSLGCSNSVNPADNDRKAAPPSEAQPAAGPEVPPEAAPEPLALPTEWRPIQGARSISDIGPLQHFGAFVAGSNDERRWLLSLDADGSQTELDLGGPGMLASVAQADSGELLVVGSSGAGFGGDPWFARVSPSGKILAEATFPTKVSGTFQAVVPREQGALIVGIQNPMTSGVTHGWVISVDSQAKPLWEQRLGDGGYHYLLDAVVLPKGGVVTVGAGKRANYSPWVAALGPQGKPGTVELHENERWGELSTAALDGGGAVYAAGTSTKEQASSVVHRGGKLQVLKVDAEGVLEWEHSWLDDVAVVGSMRPMPEGGVMLLVGTVGDPSSEFPTGKLLLVRVPADGSEPKVSEIEAEAVALTLSTIAAEIVGMQGTEVVLLQLDRQADQDDAYRWRLTGHPL